MRVLHLTESLSVNPGAFRSTRLVETLRNRGVEVLVRHMFVQDRRAWIGQRPDAPHDPFDRDEFDTFAPDVIVAEGGLQIGPGMPWRIPEAIALDFVDSGGVIIVTDLSLNGLQDRETRAQLGFFGSSMDPRFEGIPYLDDPEHCVDHPRRMHVSPEDMAVSQWLKPAFDGIDAIQAWGAVPILVGGHVAATAAWSARTLVNDRFVGTGPGVFAGVREIGLGFTALVTAQVAVDEIVIANPDNATWLANLASLLSTEARRRVRLRGSTSDHPRTAPLASIADLIAGGESDSTEFKESFQFNTRTKQLDQALRHEVTRTVCGFLNSPNGGTLLLGVDDHGEVRGLARDYRLLGRKQSSDEFELRLRDHLGNTLSSGTAGLVHMRFELFGDLEVCALDVKPSDEPVFAAGMDDAQKKSEFWIRDGNSTTKLFGLDMERYRRTRWPAPHTN